MLYLSPFLHFLLLFPTVQKMLLPHNEIFSCDPEINNWVNKNISLITTFSRDEFAKLDESTQRAAFRSLSPDKKLQLWRVKLVKEIELCSTEEERNHIEKLLGMTDVKLYTDKDFSLNFVIQAQNWYDEAIQKIGWTRTKVALMVASLYLSDGSDNIQDFSSAKSMIPECACRRSIFCAVGFNCSTSGSCNESTHGCGWLFVESCIGQCSMTK